MLSDFMKSDWKFQPDPAVIQAINIIAEQSHAMARKKGWWDKYLNDRGRIELTPDAILAKLMLAVGEVSEAAEEVRDGHHGWRFEHPDGAVKMDLGPGWPELQNGFKPEGFIIEIADAIIRLFDIALAVRAGDIGTAIAMKMYYNQTRKHRHGGRLA